MSTSPAATPFPLPDTDRQTLEPHGISDAHIDYYQRAGIDEALEMVRLHNIGIGGADAYYFSSAGIADANTMIHLTSAGVRGYQAHVLSEVGISDLDGMIHLINAGVCHYTARDFAYAGIRDADSIIRLLDADLDATATWHLHEAGLTEPEQMLAFAAASKLNGVQPTRLQSLLKKLDAVGPLGARIKDAHIAPKATVNVICNHRNNDIAPLLEQLTDEQLRNVVGLAEDHERISGDDMRALIAAMSC